MITPGDWRKLKLDELGTVGRGRSRHRPRNDPNLYGGDYPFFQTGDVKAAELHLHKACSTYNELGLKQSKLWEPGTLCITIAANIAESAILDVQGCFPDSIVGFIADPEIADVKFVKYKLDTLKILMQSASRGTTQDNLSLDKLMRFDFRVPGIVIQKRIAGILSAYDDLIENNTRRIAILEEMARRLYEEWFVHFRFPGYETTKFVDGLPEGWAQVTTAEMFDTAAGGTPSRKKPEYYGGSIAWVKSKELLDGPVLDTEEKITDDGLFKSSAKLFPENSVIVAMYGANIGQLGVLTAPAATNQACCALLPSGQSHGWCYGFLAMLSRRSELIELRAGAAQQNISQVIIKKFPMLRATPAIHSQFEIECQNYLGLSFKLNEVNRNLRAQRDLLLPKLVSGEIDVTSAEKSLEDAA